MNLMSSNPFTAALRAARTPDVAPPDLDPETSSTGSSEGAVGYPDTDWTGRVLRVVFRGPTFGVVHIQADSGAVATVCGAALHDVGQGERVRARGRWELDARHGRQLRAETVTRETPATVDGLVACLGALVDGVGEGLARRFVVGQGGVEGALCWLDATDRLGHESVERLIGLRRGLALREAWQERRAAHTIELALASLGLTPGLRTKLRAKYGAEAAAVCRVRPYDLAFEVDGVGFATADAVAAKVGVDRNSPARKTAALAFALEDEASNRGHVYCTKDQAKRQIERLCEVRVSDEALSSAMANLVSRNVIVLGGNGGMGLRRLVEAEQRIARRVTALVARGEVPLPISTENITALASDGALARLADEQHAAVRLISGHPFAVMTGGPGVGKTTTTQAVCSLWTHTGLTFALCAPTGRAARRLSEATGVEATTIHRLLQYRPALGFVHTAANPLTLDALLVDESSMVDVELMAALLDALPPHARLVLVGDADQLPPVGPGAPFRDLCARTDLPLARLTQVHRQAQGSRVVGASRQVLVGQAPTPSARGDRSPGVLFVLEEPDAAALASMVVEAVAELVPKTFGVPSAEVQVIAPMRRGVVGVTALNTALQARLNPRPVHETWNVGDLEIRLGDRVMQTKNDYARGVVNGELGVVVGVDKGTGVTVQYAGGVVGYEREQVRQIDLAYCSTVHKVQGAEFAVCLIVCHDSHSIMLERSLLYTAITRAKRACVVMGSAKAVARAAKTARSDARRTTLSAWLDAAVREPRENESKLP